MKTLDGLSDTDTIGGNRYGHYIVQWVWPDDSVNSELGDLALEKNVKIFASVSARMWKSNNPNSSNGDENSYDYNQIWSIINSVIAIIIGIALFALGYTLHHIYFDNMELSYLFLNLINHNVKQPKSKYRSKNKYNTPGSFVHPPTYPIGVVKSNRKKRKIGVRDE